MLETLKQRGLALATVLALLFAFLESVLPSQPARAERLPSHLPSCAIKLSAGPGPGGKVYQVTPAMTPGYRETSEYLLGSVAVAVVLPESNGVTEASRENWTPAEEQQAIASVQRALDWWSSRELAARLSFTVEVHRQVATRFEPALHGIDDDEGWISDILSSLGFNQGSTSQRAYDFANDLRKRKGTPWAFIAFVLDGSPATSTVFPGSDAVAYASLGGPYTVLLDEPRGWGAARLDNIAAHETGHIFYATHTDDGKPEISGYLGALDGNVGVSLMSPGEPSWVLAPGTRLQVGWRDSDGDGIMDILDTVPQIELVLFQPGITDLDSLQYHGSAHEAPYPNKNPHGSGRHITISNIQAIKFRVDDGAWLEARAEDGSFNSPVEDFAFTTPSLSVGTRQVEAVAVSSSGNESGPPAGDRVTISGILIDQSRVSAPRASISSRQQVGFRAIWAHSGEPIAGGSLWINDQETRTDPSGWAALEVSSATTGKTQWAVTRSQANGITRFNQQAPSPGIIWDRVVIKDLKVSRERADLGSAQVVTARAVLEYDNLELGALDELFINGKPAIYDPKDKAFALPWSSDKVGREEFRVTAARQKAYGIDVLSQPPAPAEIVWDRVKIMLQSPHPRVDVGSTAPLSIIAIYEYDGAPLQGKVALNDEPRKDLVGKFSFKGVAVKDDRYQLGTFSTNEAEIIWDKVAVELAMPLPRVEVGKEAPIQIKASYQYDNRPFDGEVFLDRNKAGSSVGKAVFGVKGISDRLYGLTVFSFKGAEVTFDRIEAQTGNESWLPGRAGMSLALSYASDGSPAEDALVKFGDLAVAHGGGGEYSATLSNWSPYASFPVTFEKAGFPTGEVPVRFLARGNTALFLVAIGLALVGFLLRRRHRSFEGVE